ncbi:MAG: hypothetical protein WA539_02380, partial [Candidatus Sulfotelmatobacter sp.]
MKKASRVVQFKTLAISAFEPQLSGRYHQLPALHEDVYAARYLAVNLEGPGLRGDKGEVEDLLWSDSVSLIILVVLYLKAVRLYVSVAHRDVHGLSLSDLHLRPDRAGGDAH